MTLVFRKDLQLPTQAIDIGQRQFPSKEWRVRQLAKSLKEDGQRYPILVRQVTRDTYKIVCGATRLRAARMLGWYRIWVKVVAGLPVDYEIAELSDDLETKVLTRESRDFVLKRLTVLRLKRDGADKRYAMKRSVMYAREGERGEHRRQISN